MGVAGIAVAAAIACGLGNAMGVADALEASARTIAAGGPADPFAIEEYPVNELGMTYGSDASQESVGRLPDLRLAAGTEGETGYIRNADLEMVFREESLSPSVEERTVLIPLYESDGVTRIGDFAVSVGP